MSYKVLLTRDWPVDQFANYGADITAAMRKLAERFPLDVTVEGLARACIAGERDLWVVLDENDRFVSFCCTSIQTMNDTGVRICYVSSLAGEAGGALVPALCETLIPWAREQGCSHLRPEGRLGWWKHLKPHGFEVYATIFQISTEAA